jgi:hypothetical protein
VLFKEFMLFVGIVCMVVVGLLGVLSGDVTALFKDLLELNRLQMDFIGGFKVEVNEILILFFQFSRFRGS